MRRMILLLTLLVGLALGPSDAGARQDDQGKIVFTSERDGNSEIYVMNADGGDVQRLTDQSGFDAMPDFSPDGSMIVFISSRAGNQNVFIMNIDGSNVLQLTETPSREYHPTFSPDGTQIAFMSERDGNVELYLMNTDGTDVQRLTDNPAFDGQPAFSPDGSQIVFVSGRDGSWQIYVMNADGSDVKRLTTSDATDSYPRFSPDGSQIAFESMPAEDISATELYLMNADGTNTYRLTDNEFFDSMPVWSPDGTQFVFVSDRDDDWMLYLMSADGSNVRPLGTGNAHHHDWWYPTVQSVEAPAILLVFGQQFIPSIYETEVPILEEAGYKIVVASHTLDTLNAKQSKLTVDPDLLLQDVIVKDYAAIIFNCDNDITFGSAIPETTRIAQDAIAQGKVLGAICSGPRVLAYADVVDGLTVTGEPSRTCQMLEDQGATCTGASVEQDGLIVTARDRNATRLFTNILLDTLAEQGAR
jgi:dipeptidyl aminopeptidase/acylaminoacyl peptidase